MLMDNLDIAPKTQYAEWEQDHFGHGNILKNIGSLTLVKEIMHCQSQISSKLF